MCNLLLQQYLKRLDCMFDLCKLQGGKTKPKILLTNRKIFAEEEKGPLAGLFSEFENVVAARGGQLFTKQQVDDFSCEMKEWILAQKREGGAGVSKEESDEYQHAIKEYKQVLVSAFINRQSSRGDTALHQAVKHQKISTIEWLLEPSPETDEPAHDTLALPSMTVLNVDHLTPFTLAARQGDQKIMKRLIDFQKLTKWKFGSVALTQIDLLQIDSFRIRDKRDDDKEHFVTFSVTMPYSKEEFDEVKEKYKSAMDDTAGVPPDRIYIGDTT